MPVYEYSCDTCHHQFELRQKFSDAPANHCPKCGGAVHKMVSTVAFSLKGGGWYAEGYGAKPESAAKTDTDSATGTETAKGSAPKEAVTTDSAPKETAASPATPAPVASQSETNSTIAEKPTAGEKAKSPTETSSKR